MTTFTVKAAATRLDELIDRAGKGESVMIMLDDSRCVALVPVELLPTQITQSDLDWFDRMRVGQKTPTKDSGQLVSEMRDEEWR